MEPNLTRRQELLKARIAAMSDSARAYALFHILYGEAADLDVLERALDAGERWAADLEKIRRELGTVERAT